MKTNVQHIIVSLGLMIFTQLSAFAAWDGKTLTFEWYSNADTLSGENLEKPFVISSESDLAALSKLVSGSVAKTSPHPNAFDGKFFVLANDLDFATPEGEKNNWTPIGDKAHPFRGIFIGNGHTISNLNIDKKCTDKLDISINVYSETAKVSTRDMTQKFKDTECNIIGLFGNIMTAEIRGLNLKNATIEGNYIIGGICGHASWDSKISSCTVEGKIKGNGMIGGIAGFIEIGCIIDSCSNYSTIMSESGRLANGGICGIAQTKCTIQNCMNAGEVSCNEAEYVGGICGLVNLFSTTLHCTNSGNISAKATKSGIFASFGGICGVVGHSCVLEESTNIGCVNVSTSQGFVGGSCGLASEETSLAFNFNAGPIHGSEGCVIGGICGINYRNTTNNNINVGNVTGDCIKGGIIGYNFKDRSIVSKCYYDKQMCPLAFGTGMTEATSPKGSNRGTEMMTTPDMVTVIFKNLNSEKWSFAKGCYPTLKDLNNSKIVQISAQPIILENEETVNNVVSSFDASTSNGMRWNFNSESISIGENGKGELLTDETADITLSDGIFERTITLKSGKR